MASDDAVLVIDDDPDVTQALSDFLAGEGYAVAVAHTGADGLRRIREGGVGLVLLDLLLPDMNGGDVMRGALGGPESPEFIIVTGHASLDSAIEALAGSAAGYLPKPVDFSRLRTIVQRAIERRRLVRENNRLQREIADRLAESEAVATIAATVSSTLDVKEALRRISRELARLLGADTAAAYLFDPATDQIVPMAAYRVPKEHLATLATSPLPLREQGFYLSLWGERRPVWSDDVASDPRFTHEMFRSFRHRSGLMLPLTLDGEVVGAFYVVWWTARRTFAERELQRLERVTAQAGLVLRNARLYEQAERNQHRLEALNEVSRRLAAVHEQEELLSLIVNEAARLLHAEAAGLRLVEGDDLVVAARTE
ncbi:MAG: response regulator, partial [Candidatus Rokubacteria bacterium]|nr:response regulator [Candidatus Rokubacteria bacterium]